MTQMNAELLDALKAAGAPEEKARAAAESVAVAESVVTKAHLDAAMATLEARLTWRMVGVAAVGVAVIKLL